MNDLELYYLLKLSITPNVGYVIGRRLILAFGSAQAVFKASKTDVLALNKVGNQVFISLQTPLPALAEKHIQAEIQYLTSNNVQAVSILDDLYPEYLKNCLDAPFVLFIKGNVNLNKKRIISIVGTRSLTKYGADFCEHLFAEIAKYDPVIVSGLAYGTDIWVHQLAIKYNLQTLAVLPTGFSHIYPKEHAVFSPQICENGGLITEFWHNKFPEKENFVKRNRVIAGLSVATILIESALKGGSLLTTDFANDYNREVFALPGRITDPYSKGCNWLIKQYRANILTDPSDLIRGLNWDLQHKSAAVQTKLFLDLDAQELLVFNFLEKNGKSFFDAIRTHSNLSSSELNTILLKLELNGLVKNLPGRFFDLK